MMDFEKRGQITQKSEQKEFEKNEGTLVKKANRLLAGMTIPETAKKMVIGTIAGIAAMGAVETQNVESHSSMDDIKLEQQFTPLVQKSIEKSRTMMSFEKDPNTHSIAAYLNIPVDNINEGAMYTSSHESLGSDIVLNHSYNKEVPMSGDDVYFISKTALAVAEEVRDGDTTEANVSLFDGLKTDARTFTFNGVEIEPVGEAMTFEATGMTKSEAILAALEEGVGYEKGIHIASESDLTTAYYEKGGKYDYNEKFVKLISNSTEGFIDHYEVDSIEEDDDGGYKVKLKITFGERPQYHLPDGVQLAGSDKEVYFEINSDTE